MPGPGRRTQAQPDPAVAAQGPQMKPQEKKNQHLSGATGNMAESRDPGTDTNRETETKSTKIEKHGLPLQKAQTTMQIGNNERSLHCEQKSLGSLGRPGLQ
jgi:hypothetical protein